MTQLEELENLPGIYQVCFRNAGIGIMFYEPPEGYQPTNYWENKDKWKQYLIVHHYYPTLEEALIEETKRLLNEHHKI